MLEEAINGQIVLEEKVQSFAS